MQADESKKLRAEKEELLLKAQGFSEASDEWIDIMGRVQEISDMLRNWEEFPPLLPEGYAFELKAGGAEKGAGGGVLVRSVLSPEICSTLLQAIAARDGSGDPLVSDDARLAAALWETLRPAAADLSSGQEQEPCGVHTRLRLYSNTPIRGSEGVVEKHLLNWDRGDLFPSAEVRIALSAVEGLRWMVEGGSPDGWKVDAGDVLLCAPGSFTTATPADGAVIRGDIVCETGDQ
eukprot:Hpha_TRINITY_DN26769_c0_g1::TRINITY_DN26769_c0_g1_i1::g.138982::m.138982